MKPAYSLFKSFKIRKCEFSVKGYLDKACTTSEPNPTGVICKSKCTMCVSLKLKNEGTFKAIICCGNPLFSIHQECYTNNCY